eukprot:gb/GECH01011731.1/.p1 GENE.gb/GECH01011731.1/~~gb/GECH01011731.1/.p1  ORF type:complete len:140 (+),score=41.97 gb/GECH01011731.1/:1-420(+)
MSEPTIFTKIIKGEIPSAKIYETEDVYAFLDINPLNKGHALVISKQEFPNIFEISDDVIAKVSVATKKVAQAVKEATGAEGVNILQNNGKVSGQEVFHYHVHVIPRFSNDQVNIDWNTQKYGEGEMDETLKKIKDHFSE